MFNNQQAAGKTRDRIKLFIIALTIITKALGDMEISNSYQLIHDNLSRIHSVDKYRNAINSQYQQQTLPDIVLTPGERRSIILQSLAHRYYKGGNKILSQQAVQDLHLLSGTQHDPTQSLLSQIGSSITVIGEIMLAEILISPTTDLSTLQKRQQALQYLIDHPKVIFQLEENLIHYAADEDGLIALLNPSDIVNSHLFKDIDNQTYLPGLTTSGTNEEIARRLRETFNLLGVLNAPIVLIGSILYATMNSQQGVVNGLLGALANLPSAIDSSISRNYQHYFHDALDLKEVCSVGSVIVLQVFALYKFYQNFQDNKAAYSFVMERSRRPGRALESANLLKKQLQKHQVLKNTMQYDSGFLKFHNSTQVQELMTLLQGAPERTPDAMSYISTHMGRYKRGLMLLRRNHSALIRIMQAVGEIDAWLTVARLLKSASFRDSNPFTFAHYETETEEPVLEIQNFWNPLLSPAVSVPSSFSSGFPFPTHTIVTGPNAAGKSTAIGGIALNVIMAQTLSITAAPLLRITPFSFIHTHTGDESETISGISSFHSESKRAIKLLKKLQDLPQSHLSITFFDEIFSNTIPKEGELGALAYMTAIKNIPQALSLSSTYYPKLTLLADKYPLSFQNYHVSANINNEGHLYYDYVLKPGFSTQSLALHILKEEGMQPELLDEIQEAMSNLESCDQESDEVPRNSESE